MISRGSTPGSKSSSRGLSRGGASLASTTSLRKELCSICGTRIDVLSSSIEVLSGIGGDIYCGPGRVRRMASGSARGEKPSGSLCSVCKAGGELDSKQSQPERFPFHASSSSMSASRLSTQLDTKEVSGALDKYDRDEEEVVTSRRPGTSGGGSRSRIRSRIETARDERFFLDED
jgi:hypothetical protein